ncbi:hypothetical protein [Mycobacteroides abscessus]|uniref:Bacterial transcriptional activator domain-containing protein n=1 Tax=Mycobacteroides abscessus TaxID=36809 RepID=A0A0U0ZQW6_9MYCO|nr:hypothetical protein [Mycobacteroides abscessus]CPV66145.1 Uncharacterised protein [Mycobacteroides abscessus]
MSLTQWYFAEDGGAVVDAAIATLDEDTPSESVMMVLAEPESLHVRPVAGAEFPDQPLPWTYDPEIRTWARPLSSLAPRQAPARPLLLPLGVASGATLIVNLEAINPLTINGPTPRITAVLRAWVMHLLLTPGRVVAAATATLTEVPGTSRFISAPTPEKLSAQLGERALSADVVILDDLSARHRFPSSAAVGIGQHLDVWTLRLSPTGPSARLTSAGEDRVLELESIIAINDAGWNQLGQTLGAPTAAAGSAPAPSPQPTPAASADADVAMGPEPHVWIQIFGNPTVTPPHGEPMEPGRRNTWTAIIAYLATVGRKGATNEEIRKACYGDNIKPETIRQHLSNIRGYLGPVSTGDGPLPEISRGGRPRAGEPPESYQLHPEVITAWDRVEQLIGAGPAHASDTALHRALNYVVGPPFAVLDKSVQARYQSWTKELIDTITDAVAGAALELATRSQGRGDQPGALWAARKGILVDPQRQDLWRLAIEVADPETRATLFTELRAAIADEHLETATRKLLP